MDGEKKSVKLEAIEPPLPAPLYRTGFPEDGRLAAPTQEEIRARTEAIALENAGTASVCAVSGAPDTGTVQSAPEKTETCIEQEKASFWKRFKKKLKSFFAAK